VANSNKDMCRPQSSKNNYSWQECQFAMMLLLSFVIFFVLGLASAVDVPAPKFSVDLDAPAISRWDEPGRTKDDNTPSLLIRIERARSAVNNALTVPPH